MNSRSSFALLAIVATAFGSASIAAAQPLVVIDPGHGGSDPGAVACGIQEADVVLDVSLRMQPLLQAAGVRVAMTRTTNTTVGLSARAAFANARSATGFVSEHSNSNAGTPATGTETFVHTNGSTRSRALATTVQQSMITAWGLRNRGVKAANFAVLRDTNMPAVLVELGFTNNCNVDARKLSSPTERQRIAEAQANAILGWLGIQPVARGTLRGVVFEDQGVGAENTTVRLGGATVRIAGTSTSTTADATGANWSFTLDAGTYTIEVARAGYVTQQRTCTVTRGGTTWCSVGLAPTATDSNALTLASAVDGGRPAADAPPVRPMYAPGCSVSARSSEAQGLWIALFFGLAALLVLRRARLRRAGSVVWALLGLVGCSEPPAAAPPAALVEERIALRRALETASYATLEDDRALDVTGVVAPRLSPDARRIAAAAPGYDELFVVDLASNQVQVACTMGHCGWEPRWVGNELHVRDAAQSGTAIPAFVARLDGEPVLAPPVTPALHAWIDDDDARVLVRDAAGTRTVSPDGDRFVSATVSPDARHVAFWGMTTGVYVHDVQARQTVHLGAGAHPSFAPEGGHLVFERTTDEGHVYTSGELFVTALAGDYATAPITATADRIERMPTLAGDVLAFVADDALHVARIRLTR